jgi:DNA-binding transcriptional ArsR family regulator
MDNPKFSEEMFRLPAGMCAALSDPKRLWLLYLLSETPHTVNDLAGETGASQPVTSRHLKILRENGLVRANRHGTSVAYSISDPRLIQVLDQLRSVMIDQVRYQAGLLNVKL